MNYPLAQLEFGFIHGLDPRYNCLHQHEHVEIVLHAKGEGFDILSGDEYAFARHTCVIHGPKQNHNVICTKKGIDVCLQLQVNDEMAQQIGEFIRIERLDDAYLREEMHFLAGMKAERHLHNQQSSNLRTTALLVDLIDHAQAAGQKEHASLADKIAEGRRFIERQFDQDISIEQAAEHLSLSADYFRHSFKKQFQESPRDYLMSLRIAHAKVLLRNTPLAQKDIAAQCGFANIRYFNTRFKHYVG
ncbi:MAG: helix-turn-helix transcriptional regulator, partial [Planctomycetes bacterium]|nr:helix-turn-helix transcriptional regulator [Planctomycetota bacterium]